MTTTARGRAPALYPSAMRHAAIPLLLAATILTGCGGPAEPAATPEQQYLTAIRGNTFWAGWDDTALLDKGKAICDAAHDSPVALGTATTVVARRFGPGPANSLTEAATGHLCP